TYSGPIGSVISPHYRGMEEFKHLSYASSLCGACTSVCPVKIDIHGLLLQNRRQSVEENLVSKKEKFIFSLFKTIALRRLLFDNMPAWLSNKLIGTYFSHGNTAHKRTFPEI